MNKFKPRRIPQRNLISKIKDPEWSTYVAKIRCNLSGRSNQRVQYPTFFLHFLAAAAFACHVSISFATAAAEIKEEITGGIKREVYVADLVKAHHLGKVLLCFQIDDFASRLNLWRVYSSCLFQRILVQSTYAGEKWNSNAKEKLKEKCQRFIRAVIYWRKVKWDLNFHARFTSEIRIVG